MTSRPRLLAALVAVLVGCAGCASSATDPSQSGAGTQTQQSSTSTQIQSQQTQPTFGRTTLIARVALTGGPISTSGRMALSDSPEAGAQVRVTSIDGVLATATTGPSGEVTLALAPGRYTVSSGCGNPQVVILTVGKVTRTQLNCYVP